MTPKAKAKELLEKFYMLNWTEMEISSIARAKKCALICVQEIILSNPHSNPFNTNQYSTMNFWKQVEQEIKKL